MKKMWHLVVSAVLLVAFATSCAEGSVGNQIDIAASLNGTDLAATSPNRPVQIVDNETAELVLSMTNTSAQPRTVRYVRFEGEVIDMIFLTYDTAISVPLAAGESRTLPPILLDFFDLGGQADGYLRGNVQLFDEDREPLGSQQVFLDARADGFSTLELFNLMLLAGTILGAAWNLLRLSQRRLPTNRLVRALRFLSVGAGAGLTLAVAFATLRIWPLSTLWWLLFTIVGAIIGYLIGLLLPGSEGDDIDLLDEEDLLEELVLERDDMLVGAAATGTAATSASSVGSTVIDVRDGDTGEAAAKTIAGGSAKATRTGAAGKETTEIAKPKAASADAKKTKASPSAKETVAGAASAAKQTTVSEAKKTIPQAPGTGVSKTVKGTVNKAASKAKDTLSDD